MVVLVLLDFHIAEFLDSPVGATKKCTLTGMAITIVLEAGENTRIRAAIPPCIESINRDSHIDRAYEAQR